MKAETPRHGVVQLLGEGNIATRFVSALGRRGDQPGAGLGSLVVGAGDKRELWLRAARNHNEVIADLLICRAARLGALVLVDAIEGYGPQLLYQLALAQELRLPVLGALVAIESVDQWWAREIQRQIEEVLGARRDRAVVAVDLEALARGEVEALEGLDKVWSSVWSRLREHVQPQPFAMRVESVERHDGRGVAAVGWVDSGEVRPGQEVAIMGWGADSERRVVLATEDLAASRLSVLGKGGYGRCVLRGASGVLRRGQLLVDPGGGAKEVRRVEMVVQLYSPWGQGVEWLESQDRVALGVMDGGRQEVWVEEVVALRPHLGGGVVYPAVARVSARLTERLGLGDWRVVRLSDGSGRLVARGVVSSAAT